MFFRRYLLFLGQLLRFCYVVAEAVNLKCLSVDVICENLFQTLQYDLIVIKLIS